MNAILNITDYLPFEHPVMVFTIVLSILLIVPIVFEKMRIPALIGLIIAGIVIGPKGLNLIARDSSMILLGTVGIIYIMFLAGLEIDLNNFKKNKYKSLIFGLLTFSIPLLAGYWVGTNLLNMDITTSLLLASMFSTQTLVTYPIVSRFGVSRDISVMVAVGGTIITDILALFTMSLITGAVKNGMQNELFFSLLGIFTLSSLFVLFITPIIVRWLLPKLKEENAHYILILAIVFLSSLIFEYAGFKAIIGSFMAGLALNKLIPKTSPLMNRIEFVGHAIFIPFFLISIGMLMDIRLLFNDFETVKIALILILFMVLSKYLAAFLSQVLLNFNRTQRQLIFGLSNSHAAATIAIVTIGNELGLFSMTILNSTIIIIIVTCFISSFVTEAASRKLAISSQELPLKENKIKQRILIPISDTEKIINHINFATKIKEKSKESIYALSIIDSEDNIIDLIKRKRERLQNALKPIIAAGKNIEPIVRVDINISNAIINNINEYEITDIILGWNHKRSNMIELFFGSIHENIIRRIKQAVYIINNANQRQTYSKIHCIIPKNAEFESSFSRMFSTLLMLAYNSNAQLQIYCNENTIPFLVHLGKNQGNFLFPINYESQEQLHEQLHLKTDNDLFIFVSARKSTISYNTELEKIPYFASKYYTNHNFIIIFPEQTSETSNINAIFNTSIILPQQINFLQKIIQPILKAFSKKNTL